MWWKFFQDFNENNTINPIKKQKNCVLTWTWGAVVCVDTSTQSCSGAERRKGTHFRKPDGRAGHPAAHALPS